MGLRKRAAGDDGFSVIEVIVAAAIMFFVLTAVIGLMGASSSMTVAAKQRAVMTNAVASYLDGLRVATWDEVVAPDEPVAITVNGILVTMDVNVELRQEDGQDVVKIISVAAVSTLNGKRQMYETSVALLRNPNFNRTLQTDPDAPVVYFMSEAPDDDGVIWADQQDAGPIFLRTKAFSPENKIKQVIYDVTGRSTTTTFSVFAPSPTVQMYYSSPALNTTAEGMGDGFQTVSVSATDEMERTGKVSRRFIVDNVAPSSVSSVTVIGLSSTVLSIQWNAATDGGTVVSPNFASHYECEVSVEPTQGESLAASDRIALNEPRWLAGTNTALAVANDGPIIYEATVADGTQNAYQRALAPFSRFEVRVRASSPRGLTNGVWIQPTLRGFTRPELLCGGVGSPYRSTCLTKVWGTGASKGTEYTLDFYLSRANFQRGSDSPTWEIEYQSAVTTPTPTGWQPFGVAPTLQSYDGNALRLTATRKFLSEAVTGRPMYFRFKVSGYYARRDGGASVPVMYTNAAGPSTYVSPEMPVYLTRNWDY